MLTVQRERLVIGALVALTLAGVGLHGYQGVATGEKPGLLAASLIFGLMSLGHAVYLLGWKRALTLFVLSATLSYMFESLSIATCAATCYAYTGVLGWKLGSVPIAIPLSWFTMMYPSAIIANLIAEGQPVSVKGGGVWMVFLALLTALVMTAWDLTLDPYMVDKVKAWVWLDPLKDNYLGIPFANYLGWVEVVFMIVLIYRLAERGIEWKPLGPATHLVVALPLISYAVSGLPDVVIGVPDATRLIAPYAMGIPLLAALSRYAQMRFAPAAAPVTTAEG